MNNVPWDPKEIAFVKKKIFEDKQHPVQWVEDLNKIFNNGRSVDGIGSLVKRTWKKRLSEVVTFPVERRPEDPIPVSEGEESLEGSVEADYKKDTAVVTTKSLNIKTLEGALEAADVDMEIWEVERHTVNFWEVTMGKRNTDTGRPENYTNCQVKVWLRRRIRIPEQYAIELLIQRMEVYSPHYEPIERVMPDDDLHMLEISLFDHHFGLLAWRHETLEDYDLDIARKLYHAAVVDILKKTAGYAIEKILFPIGQDFFHVNNPEGTTPRAQNQLDVDGRLAKVFETGEIAVIKALEHCRQVAPVKVIWVPGNHDPETSYYLIRVLKAWFRDCADIEVDVEPTVRKYEAYGVNLIGYTHGSEEPHRDLPRIMADDEPKLWAKSKYREIHIGHKHKKREMQFVGADSFGSVTVRMLPSLSRIDAWHFMKGYVGGDRAAQCFLYSKENGLAGSFLSRPKLNIRKKS